MLVLAPFPPRDDGRHGGSRATGGTIRALAARHRVALLCLRAPDEPPVAPALLERCELVEEIERPVLGTSRPARVHRRVRELRSGLRGTPGWVSGHRVERLGLRVHELGESFAPDVVQVHGHVMAQYLPALGSTRAVRVLVVLEPGVTAALERWRAARGIRRRLRGVELAAWRRYEPQVLQAADVVIALTDRDRDGLRALAPSAAVVTVPLATDLPTRPLNPLGSSPPSVVFVGNFAHWPNVDAAWSLATEILPAVRRRVDGLTAFVVGPGPPPALLALGDRHTIVTGAVADPTPYLDRATVVAAPIWSGGGMRLKVLEALAAGKALVATPRALEGLELRSGEQAVVADTPDRFAAAIVELVGDPLARAALAAGARRWAVANLGWDTMVARYERVWMQASAVRRGAAADPR